MSKSAEFMQIDVHFFLQYRLGLLSVNLLCPIDGNQYLFPNKSLSSMASKLFNKIWKNPTIKTVTSSGVLTNSYFATKKFS